MNPLRTEMRVQDIVKRVVAGGKVEDDFVEAKAVWPAALQKTARRIAGMANAAGGQPILWIIGLDEDGHQVAELGDTDIANWWPAVEAKFADDVAPSMRTMTIGTDHGSVVCLHFDTDRAPYVVSTDSTGGVTREIPWREGTRVRTASRRELLSMLRGSVAVPELELIDPVVTFRAKHVRNAHGDPVIATDVREISLTATLFIDVDSRVMLPRHKWGLRFSTIDGDVFPADHIVFARHHTGFPRSPEPEHRYGAMVRTAGLYIDGPDSIQLEATAVVPTSAPTSRVDFAAWIEIEGTFPTNGAARIARLNHRLGYSSGHGPGSPPTTYATWARPVPAP